MNKKEFSKKEAISFGWRIAKENIGLFVILIIISFLVSAVTGALQRAGADFWPLAMLFTLVSIAASMTIQMGFIRISLAFVDGRKPDFAEVFSEYRKIFNLFAAFVLYGLIVLAGLILLVVPGIIWMIQFGYYQYLIVDKNLGPIEALKASSKITYGAKKDLLVFGLLLAGAALLGALALLIGLLWAVPTIMLAGAYVYRKLQQMTDSAAPIAEPQPQTPSVSA